MRSAGRLVEWHAHHLHLPHTRLLRVPAMSFAPVIAIPQSLNATVLGKRNSNDGDADSKRQRTAVPSAVLFMRGFDACGGVTEAELRAVCAPFGQVVKTLIMHTKGQAFVQLESVAHAVQMQRCAMMCSMPVRA